MRRISLSIIIDKGNDLHTEEDRWSRLYIECHEIEVAERLSFRENMDLQKRQIINEKALKGIVPWKEIVERPILPDDGINRKDFSNRSKLISEWEIDTA